MIIPAGKRRDQVNQGAFKNELFMNNPFSNTLNKSALTGTDALRDTQPGQEDPALQDAMRGGSGGGMAGLDQMERQNSPGTPGTPGMDPGMDPGMQGQMEESMQSSPASQFLSRDDSQDGIGGTEALYAQEDAKIRQFIGNDFGLGLKLNNDGTFTVSITPDRPVQDPTGFMDGLMQYIGGQVDIKEKNTPSATGGGPLSMTYTPGGSSHKVEKQVGNRR